MDKKSLLREPDLLVACLGLAVLIVITVSGVVARYCVNRPFGWMEEVQLWSFMWIVFFGACAVARKTGHIAIDAFVGLFPRALRQAARSISHIVTIAVLAFFGYYAWRLTLQMYTTGRDTNILSIPYYIIYGAVPLACLIIVVTNIYQLLNPAADVKPAVQAAQEGADNV